MNWLKFITHRNNNFLSRGEIALCLMAMAIISSILFYIKSLSSTSPISFTTILLIKMGIWMFWAIWIPLIFFLSKKIPVKKSNMYLGALFHLPISIIIVCLHIFLYALIISQSQIPNIQDQSVVSLFRGFFFSQFEWYFMTYWALMFGSYAFNYFRKYNESKIKSAQLDALLTKAKLNALKMQLHPHFLFNTLNTISSLVRQEQKTKSISMLTELGDLLRLVLNQNEKQFVPLIDELSFIKKYIVLEEKRFKDKIKLNIVFDKELKDALIPSFILQPLIENSIYHGLSKKIDAHILKISIEYENQRVKIQIYNDGFPLPENFHLTKTKGIGLINSIERLSQLYGEDYSFDISNFKNGVITKLNIPLKR